MHFLSFVSYVGCVIPYVEIVSQADQERREAMRRRRSRAASKTAYTCPNCYDVRTWGRPGLRLACRECDVDLEAEGFGDIEADAPK